MGARQDAALQHRVVDQLVVQDEVVAAEEMTDHRDIGRVAAAG